MSAPLGKGIVVGSSVLSLMSFVVALGGLSALTHDCSGGSWTWTDTTSECAKFTQLEWYSIFLNLFLTIALVVLALKDALRQYQSTLHSFLALSTALLTICARNYLSPGSYTYSMAVGNYAVASKNAAVAGTIMMCIFNYAIMLALGWAAAGAKGAEDTYAA